MKHNILFCGLGAGSLTETVIEKIICKYRDRIDGVYGVYAISQFKPRLKYDKLLYYWDFMINANYDKYMDYICDPLDSDAFHTICRYDMQIMYMVRRCGMQYQDYETGKAFYYAHLKYWNDFLKRFHITRVVFAGIPHEVFDYIIYCLCLHYEIPVVLSDTMSICDTLENNRRMFLNSINYDDKNLSESFDYVRQQYRNVDEDKILLPESMQGIYDFYVGLSKQEINKQKSIIPYGKREEEVFRYFGKPDLNLRKIIRAPRSELKRYVRTKKNIHLTETLIKVYNCYAVDADYEKKYIYIPLHYSPECTSSPQGLDYSDQASYIDILASNVPDDVFLYVREHPAQTAFGRNATFYDRLAKMRNVIFIKEDENTYNLQKNALAVASLTGTAGYECQYFGVPFIMFGDYISKYMPGTYRVHNNSECKMAINEILGGEKKVWNHRDIKIYLRFVYDNSVSLTGNYEDVVVGELLKRMRLSK